MASACTSNVFRYVSPRLVLRRLCADYTAPNVCKLDSYLTKLVR